MIDANRVTEIIRASLYTDEELKPYGDAVPTDVVIGEGLSRKFGFNPKRLNTYKDEVFNMLMQLDDDFMHSKGGGMTFLKMPFDKEGNQWGEHINAAELVALGTALGLVALPLPRDMWSALPGGVPYVVVRDK